jgi:aryl-alcohol dehydrogenase-like predicted oxidoreductase
MEYRTLGKTGLEVSVLSFGASSLGSVFREIDEGEGIRTVHTALDLGINFIDCSPFYGLTKAETVLGKALAGVPRDRYILATKCGRYGMEAPDFDFSAARVTASVDESLQRLQVEYLDLIQCHDIEFGDLDQVVGETIPALRRLQEQGKVGFVGITGLPFNAFQYVMDRVDVDTVLSYCHYSLNDTSLDAFLPYMKKKGAGIINASPLSMGLLIRRGPPEWHPAEPAIKEACRKAVDFCNARDVDIAKVAVQFSLANRDVHTTLVGTANPENIKKNVQWLEEPMDEDLVRELLAIMKPVQRWAWHQGVPRNYATCVKCGQRTGGDGYFYEDDGPRCVKCA